MNVSDIMSKDVQTISTDASILDAAQKMKSVDAGVLPVVTGDGVVVGIITDRDIVLRAVAQGADSTQMRASEAMSPDPVTCRPDCPIDAAANTMRDQKIRRLIITEDLNKNVVGIVSLGDIAVRAKEMELVGAATEGLCHSCG
ncbi:MAG: CBS domain-containing protein [Pirellulales bacterium]|nr:CBS domain-containing protein [Pirellulales bacterium]